jgi:hypothetical protein
LYQLPLVRTPWIFHVFWGMGYFFNWQIAFSALYTVNLNLNTIFFLSYVISSLYLTFIYSLIKIFSYLSNRREII